MTGKKIKAGVYPRLSDVYDEFVEIIQVLS